MLMPQPYSPGFPTHDLHLKWNDRSKEAHLYEKLPQDRVRCHLCPRRCLIAPGAVGFCKVRKNLDGILYAQSYGKATHETIEKIETEAVFHYMPGARILSLGNFGCNLDCDYCQNWMFSQFQYTPESSVHEYTADEVVAKAVTRGIPILSWTYNDPAVWFEFVIDTARRARAAGLKNLFKSAFFLTEEAVRELATVIDVFAVSIKAMDPEYYRRFTKGWLEPVLAATRMVHAAGAHCEISNLVVTGLTNNERDYDRMIDFVLGDLSPDTPLHFTRFHPDYKYMGHPKTPLSDVTAARDRARARGLRYAYVGNAFEADGLHTDCPGCRTRLVERYGLHTYVQSALADDGACRACGFRTNIRELAASPRLVLEPAGRA